MVPGASSPRIADLAHVHASPDSDLVAPTVLPVQLRAPRSSGLTARPQVFPAAILSPQRHTSFSGSKQAERLALRSAHQLRRTMTFVVALHPVSSGARQPIAQRTTVVSRGKLLGPSYHSAGTTWRLPALHETSTWTGSRQHVSFTVAPSQRTRSPLRACGCCEDYQSEKNGKNPFEAPLQATDGQDGELHEVGGELPTPCPTSHSGDALRSPTSPKFVPYRGRTDQGPDAVQNDPTAQSGRPRVGRVTVARVQTKRNTWRRWTRPDRPASNLQRTQPNSDSHHDESFGKWLPGVVRPADDPELDRLLRGPDVSGASRRDLHSTDAHPDDARSVATDDLSEPKPPEGKPPRQPSPSANSRSSPRARSQPEVHACSVCARYADLLLRDVPYDQLPLNLRMKQHFDKYRGSSWAIIVIADLLADFSVGNILREIHSFTDFAAVVAGCLTAYALADLASGVGTWFTFNFLTNGERACYCDGTRDFARRIAINCAVVLPFLYMLLMHAPENAFVYSFLVYFLSFVSVIPALVDWSGSSSFPPSVARALRRIGLALHDHANPLGSSSASVHEVARTGHRYSFLNHAWHAIVSETKAFTILEKWIFLSSKGRLVPKAWRIDPSARCRAFSEDVDECLPKTRKPRAKNTAARKQLVGADHRMNKKQE